MIAGARLVLLGVWAGALGVWILIVVPAAFGSLPGTELAADLAGQTLQRIDASGLALAALTAAAGLRWRSAGFAGIARGALPLLAGLLHAASLWGVSPEIHALREAAGGSVTGVSATDPTLARFGQLHALSTLIFSATAGLVLLCTVWDVAVLRRQTRGRDHGDA